MSIKILQGNCLEKIKQLDDLSIDCVVSSPPYYGLRDYGVEGQFGLEPTIADYISNTVKVFEAMRPKLKDTATIWWNVGDSYASKDSTIKAKDLMMIPNRVAIALQEAGWYIRSEIIWHKPNPMPKSVKDRPTSAHEKIWLITKNKKYYYDAKAIKEDSVDYERSKKRYEKPFMAGDKHESGGYSAIGQKHTKGMKVFDGKRNKRNVWTVTTKPCKHAHFATFPKDLIEPCILAGCPINGTVLDPFGGSGTVGIVAENNKRNSILIELNPEYIDIMNLRFSDEIEYKLLD